jgi:hypothetical protein
LEAACGVTFHIEHVYPVSLGGATAIGNLALSCPGCNLAKACRMDGFDHADKVQRLFNPRDYSPWLLGWHLNFQLDHESGRIVGRTGCGEATVITLRINDRQRVFARKLQIDAGLIA